MVLDATLAFAEKTTFVIFEKENIGYARPTTLLEAYDLICKDCESVILSVVVGVPIITPHFDPTGPN